MARVLALLDPVPTPFRLRPSRTPPHFRTEKSLRDFSPSMVLQWRACHPFQPPRSNGPHMYGKRVGNELLPCTFPSVRTGEWRHPGGYATCCTLGSSTSRTVRCHHPWALCSSSALWRHCSAEWSAMAVLLSCPVVAARAVTTGGAAAAEFLERLLEGSAPSAGVLCNTAHWGKNVGRRLAVDTGAMRVVPRRREERRLVRSSLLQEVGDVTSPVVCTGASCGRSSPPHAKVSLGETC